MANRNTNRRYQDFALNFQPVPNTGDVSIVAEENAIKQSIKILVKTDIYGRLFASNNKSGGVSSMLFATPTSDILSQLEDRIESVIENHEPRARLLNVTVSDRLLDKNAIEVGIVFRAKTSTEDVSINFFLHRAA